jgi:hypothetical protein
MSKSFNHRGLETFTFSDAHLYHLLEEQDSGLQELPVERKFLYPSNAPKRKRLSRIRKIIRSSLQKRRRYAYQTT